MSSAPHPVSSTAQGQDPVSSVTDGAAQLALNNGDDAAAAQKKQQQQQGKKDKQEKKQKASKDADASSKAPLELTPPPEFFAHRMQLFDKLKAEQDAAAAGECDSADAV